MSISKIVIANGVYNSSRYKLLVAFDDFDEPIDIIELNSTKIGRTYLATVEKVLKDMDCSILKLDSSTKGFIENSKLDPDFFEKYQTTKNIVSQGDRFFVKISKDKKGNKPYSCDFLRNNYDGDFEIDFVRKYIESIDSQVDFVTDDESIAGGVAGARFYNDEVSLWSLYSLSSLLDHLLSRRVYLENGGSLAIDYTEAASLIDVNSANANKDSSNFEINRIACTEIARQIRLRNISGIIIIDFLKMNKDEEAQIIDIMNNAVIDDSSKCNVYEFTRLGLLELTRTRKMSPLHEIFAK